MVTSCAQNNIKSTDMLQHVHLSTPHRTSTDFRASAQTVAPSTPRTRVIKTPLPRLRSSALRLSAHRSPVREDLDRFIPSRRRMHMELCRRKLNCASESSSRVSSSTVACSGPANLTEVARIAKLAYEKHLLSTLCNVSVNDLDDNAQLKSLFRYGNASPFETCAGNRRRSVGAADPFAMDFLRSSTSTTTSPIPKFNAAAARAISSRPECVLDVPLVVSDFYTNPLSWSKNNVLAVALGSSVYLFDVSTRAVHELVDMSTVPVPRDGSGNSNLVKAVKWCTIEGMTHYLAVGTDSGVRMYDTVSRQEVQTSLCSGSGGGAVRALCWNDSLQCLTVGYATGKLASLDIRSGSVTGMTWRESPLSSTSSSVCNVAWNAAGTCLASGRNDNTIHLWDACMTRGVQEGGGPRLVLESHKAAVKGLAWCPYRRDFLASGGGNADRCIKLWDACSGRVMNSVSTGNQVSSLVWGRHHH